MLNNTFHTVDSELSVIADKDHKMHSGCTVVAAFLRIEDAHGAQSFLPSRAPPEAASAMATSTESSIDGEKSASSSGTESTGTGERKKNKKRSSRLVSAFKALSSSSQNIASPPSSPRASVDLKDPSKEPGTAKEKDTPGIVIPPHDAPLRRVLYTANAGDARGVLCRAGKAVRLTYDHKGSDAQEAKRITDAGGFVMGGRVNGELYVSAAVRMC